MLQRSVVGPSRALFRQRHPWCAATAIAGQSDATSITRHDGRGMCGYGAPQAPIACSARTIATNNAPCVRSLADVGPSSSLASAVGTSNKRLAAILNKCNVQIRTFRNVGHYHDVADDTLHAIQDAVEEYIEEHFDAGAGEEDDIPEVNYASGVLTLSLPPHGTWVINKQTPNEQLWWSSPISGPKRYEYDEERERWVYSRILDEQGSGDFSEVDYGEGDTLVGILNKELHELFGEYLGV